MSETPGIFVISNTFPLPTKPMRLWSLDHVSAFDEVGCRTRAVGYYPHVPRLVGRVWGRARAFSDLPVRHRFGDTEVRYVQLPLTWSLGRGQWVLDKHPAHCARQLWRDLRGPLIEAAEAFEPDAIYAVGTRGPHHLAAELGRELGVRAFASGHSLAELRRCRESEEHRTFFRESCGRLDGLAVPAPKMQREAAELLGSDRVRWIPNGVAEPPPGARAEPRPASIRDRRVVFACGSFLPRKGFPLLIDAFADASRDRPELRLRIAGDGPEEPLVRGRIERHGLNDRVTLLGRVDHDRVWQEMAWADVFALASRDEPFGVVYLEAAAAARPSIYGRDGGIAEVFEDRVHGYAVEPGDRASLAGALRDAFSDDRRLADLGKNAHRLFRQRFTRARFARSYLNLFGLHDPAEVEAAFTI